MSIRNYCGEYIPVLLLLIAAALFSPQTVEAQKYPLELSSNQTNMAKLDEHEGSMAIKTDHASLIIPLLPFDSFSLYLYLKEDQKTFSYKDSFTEFTLQRNDQTYQVDDLPEKLVMSTQGLIFFLPIGESGLLLRRDQKLATDYEEVNEEDRGYLNQVMLMLDREKDERWSFGLANVGGIAADTYWPLIGYKYKTDDLKIDIVFPSYGYLFARLGDLFYVIVDGTVESDSYRLTEELPWNSSIYSTLNFTARIELGITPFAGLEIGASYGANVYREVTISDSEDNEIGNLNLENTSTWSIQVQLRI